MKTKKSYSKPQLEVIVLDNEIALILESTPPVGPGETMLMNPEYLDNNPFNTYIV